jgi:hypothetical protein
MLEGRKREAIISLAVVMGTRTTAEKSYGILTVVWGCSHVIMQWWFCTFFLYLWFGCCLSDQ